MVVETILDISDHFQKFLFYYSHYLAEYKLFLKEEIFSANNYIGPDVSVVIFKSKDHYLILISAASFLFTVVESCILAPCVHFRTQFLGSDPSNNEDDFFLCKISWIRSMQGDYILEWICICKSMGGLLF